MVSQQQSWDVKLSVFIPIKADKRGRPPWRWRLAGKLPRQTFPAAFSCSPLRHPGCQESNQPGLCFPFTLYICQAQHVYGEVFQTHGQLSKLPGLLGTTVLIVRVKTQLHMERETSRKKV